MEVASVRQQIEEIEKSIEAIPRTSLVMQELPKPRESHIHIRGGFLTLGDPVVPGTPAVFHQTASSPREASAGSADAENRTASRDTERRQDTAERNIETLKLEARRWGLLIEPPLPDTAFDRVARYFSNHLRDALHCPNPDCARPYFFKNEEMRTQKYCSAECSRAARLNAKAEWWERTGARNRKESKSKKTKGGR